MTPSLYSKIILFWPKTISLNERYRDKLWFVLSYHSDTEFSMFRDWESFHTDIASDLEINTMHTSTEPANKFVLFINLFCKILTKRYRDSKSDSYLYHSDTEISPFRDRESFHISSSACLGPWNKMMALDSDTVPEFHSSASASLPPALYPTDCTWNSSAPREMGDILPCLVLSSCKVTISTGKLCYQKFLFYIAQLLDCEFYHTIQNICAK